MKSTLTGIAVIFLVLISLGIYKNTLSHNNNMLGGGSIQGGAYNSTTTIASVWQFPGVASTTKTVKNGAGILGSIVITSSAAGTLYIYDGTTTVTHADYPTTTLAVFPASTAAGTYILDVAAAKGIVVETSNGVAPVATISWQ